MHAPLSIGFLLYPHLTQLDLTGPAQVFSHLPGATLHLVAKARASVPCDGGIALTPTTDFDTCLPLDILCVPGGPGTLAALRDAPTLAWLRRQGERAAWVTSVCSGSLLLGAGGLLQGYRAACHWNYREHLARFGAVPDAARIVRDRNRVSGGGVTAGIDFALELAALTHGRDQARAITLMLEYAPAPPFDCGRPEQADAATIARAVAALDAAVARLS